MNEIENNKPMRKWVVMQYVWFFLAVALIIFYTISIARNINMLTAYLEKHTQHSHEEKPCDKNL